MGQQTPLPDVVLAQQPELHSELFVQSAAQVLSSEMQLYPEQQLLLRQSPPAPLHEPPLPVPVEPLDESLQMPPTQI